MSQGSRRRVLAAALMLALSTTASLRAAGARSSTLMIVLDAVPYSLLEELTRPENGPFQELKGPVPLISTFPSSTSVALGGMLAPFGIEKSPGYEARFFDWSQRRVRGGGPVSYFRVEFGWREFFDWKRKGPFRSMVEAVRPVRSGIKRLRKAINAFVDSEDDFYSIYIAATDIVGHVRSPAALRVLFEELDAMLASARVRRPDPFHVVIFSDHGMAGGEPLKNVWRPIRRTLREAGLRYAKRLRQGGDIVLTPFGLVSNFEAYTQDDQKEEVARLLAGVAGIDLCIYKSEQGWTITSVRGQASFQRRSTRQGTEWRYESVEGADPLGVAEMVSKAAPPGEAVWLSDSQWFDATALGPYPDALYRLAGSFELVVNPASILCSLSPGHMYGPRKAEILARIGKGRLRWTHGALEREATLGFLMSDAPNWRPPVAARFDSALIPFLESFGARPAASSEQVGTSE